jgi:hypothetical protein
LFWVVGWIIRAVVGLIELPARLLAWKHCLVPLSSLFPCRVPVL